VTANGATRINNLVHGADVAQTLPLHHARLEACDFRHNNRGTDPRLRAHGHHEQFSHQHELGSGAVVQRQRRARELP
uniref:Copper-containing nitrite reductase n=1 Tax=Macrostomum lignano TaxID=282301 RepID=A0A1I8FG52_9PLAT